MSKDSKHPKIIPSGNLNISKDFIGFGENDLWELDNHPTSEQEQQIDAKKSYGKMANAELPENSKSYPAEKLAKFFFKFSKLEKISLFAIASALFICSALAIIHLFKQIPVESEFSKKVSLPVNGKILSVTSIETYWRSPNKQGDNADIVKSGVILIPAIKIQVSGSSGAIRIFFRDSDGSLVGDSTTLPISGKQTLTISATDGFADMGMHASYRTGEDRPWIVQALEGPSVDAPIQKFKTLFTTEISTHIR